MQEGEGKTATTSDTMAKSHRVTLSKRHRHRRVTKIGSRLQEA